MKGGKMRATWQKTPTALGDQGRPLRLARGRGPRGRARRGGPNLKDLGQGTAWRGRRRALSEGGEGGRTPCALCWERVLRVIPKQTEPGNRGWVFSRGEAGAGLLPWGEWSGGWQCDGVCVMPLW